MLACRALAAELRTSILRWDIEPTAADATENVSADTQKTPEDRTCVLDLELL